jgi:hypothetical protein
MAKRIFDLLKEARSAAFVGREKELDFFSNLAFAEDPSVYLLYVHGPGGQGKTTLLNRFRELCEEKQVLCLRLDGREITAHPSSIMEALMNALELSVATQVFETLENLNSKIVIFIDTYEKLTPIDDWMRQEFLPQLPDHVFTVIVSRNPPAQHWLADPGWKALLRVMQLRNLSPDESIEFLAKKGVPESDHRAALDFTHGHPLALSLIAEIYAYDVDQRFDPSTSPDIVRSLLDLFLEQVPGPAHRAALEICVLALNTTEPLLQEAMELMDAMPLFDWLRQLSFIESNKLGLYPHDLVREAVTADIRWRNPQWYADLHDRIRNFYIKRIREAGGEVQRRYLLELTYLHRLSPVVKQFFEWQENGSNWIEGVVRSDLPLLEKMVEKHEGSTSAAIFKYWAEHPASQIWVWRDTFKVPIAFVLKIEAQGLDAEAAKPDPNVGKLLAYRDQHLHLRSGEQLALFRFWMAEDTYQSVSNLQSSIFLSIVQYYFTPGLAISMLSCGRPNYWQQMLNYADLYQISDLDFVVGDVPFGWYAHDWRKRPPFDWLDLLGKREIGDPINQDTMLNNALPEVMILSEAEFSNSVELALKNYHQRDFLMDNPLIRSRLVLKETGVDADIASRIAFLKKQLETELKHIEASPTDNKFYRVLYRTYFNPVGSQEKTADFLNMSFSTYRRYLKTGVERITAPLWRQEIE